MGVAMPPMDAAYAIESRLAIASCGCGLPMRCSTTPITERTVGSIMTVVAMLEIHMLSVAEAIMNPATSMGGREPTKSMMVRAMRRCRPQRSMARAIMKPPMKRKMTGCA